MGSYGGVPHLKLPLGRCRTTGEVSQVQCCLPHSFLSGTICYEYMTRLIWKTLNG